VSFGINGSLPGQEWFLSDKEPNLSSKKTRENVYRYLEWAYSEAANVITRYHPKFAFRHVGSFTPESERERATRKQ